MYKDVARILFGEKRCRQIREKYAYPVAVLPFQRLTTLTTSSHFHLKIAIQFFNQSCTYYIAHKSASITLISC